MPHYSGPLLTRATATALLSARDAGASTWTESLDLERSRNTAQLGTEAWQWRGQRYPYPPTLKDRTIYYWDGADFLPAARYAESLIKLVPTDWGAPTFEIDGIKMLPTAKASPLADAQHKVALVEPHDKVLLDTCGGLGYFAACCIEAGVSRIVSFEKNRDVLWLRTLNPWSPDPDAPDLQTPAGGSRLQLVHADVCEAICKLADASMDALLHDPPRFSIAGDLYSQAFYQQLARVLRSGGRLFHYTGSPHKLSRGRNLAHEVAKRLELAGFSAQPMLDGVLAIRR